MRGFLIAMACGACWHGTAWAGVYHLDEPTPVPPPTIAQFQFMLDELLSIDLPQSRTRQYCQKRIMDLEEKGRSGNLSIDDRINASAYYIRLRDYEKAVAILTPVETARNFMVLSNLATANYLAGPQDRARLDRAISYSTQTLAVWPTIWPGMNRTQLYRFLRAEKYFLVMLRERAAEMARSGGKMPEAVDDLFPRVRTLGASGTYRAGSWPAPLLVDLPPDTLAIVEQLLLWMPDDSRLYWLLAELLNAQGDVLTASDILNKLVGRGFSFKEIQDHRRVLNEARPFAEQLTRETPRTARNLLWSVAPRTGTLEPGVGTLTNEIAYAAVLAWLAKIEETANAKAAAVSAAPPATPRASWLPDVQHVLVSFLAGVVVALLGAMQFREMRRRHPGAAEAPKP